MNEMPKQEEKAPEGAKPSAGELIAAIGSGLARLVDMTASSNKIAPEAKAKAADLLEQFKAFVEGDLLGKAPQGASKPVSMEAGAAEVTPVP